MRSGLVGMLLVLCLILPAALFSGASGFLNVPSLVICLLMPIALSMASAGVSDLGHALRALRCLIGSPQEPDLTVRDSDVLRHMISYAYTAGVIGAMIGWIQMLRRFDDLSALPVGIALSILTIFYSIIISECILRPAVRRIEWELGRHRG